MKRSLTLISTAILALLAPQLVLAQWSEGQEGQLVIRGGWLFDSVSDERRPNLGLVLLDGKIVEVDADLQQQVLSAANVIDLVCRHFHRRIGFYKGWDNLSLQTKVR